MAGFLYSWTLDMGEASAGCRRTTLETQPVAERTHTAFAEWFANATILATTSCRQEHVAGRRC
jgi:hypothetical protein